MELEIGVITLFVLFGRPSNYMALGIKLMKGHMILAAEKVTIPAEDTQFVDQDDGYFVQNMNFTSPEITQSSNQEKRAGKWHLDEQPTLTSRPKRIKNSIGNSLAKSVD
ncbi:hypothetical protein H5410_018288 [Solanum commersonii]|uniref:Uncharacterized protein n=1 Tax=Solanum commersonii TaxID=4109 RepID=A0A9J6A1Y7_SOLCO|nr:hypothetical protein H5410_018288 [Solanum commersonii]